MELEEIKNVLLDICIYKGDKDGLTAEEYSAIKSAVDQLTKQEKMVGLIEKECRYRLAFAKGIRRREKRNPDDFNQGLEFESATIMNLLSGEPHWEYEGQYFDDIDKQVEKLKAEESKQMINNIKDIEQICKQIDELSFEELQNAMEKADAELQKEEGE